MLLAELKNIVKEQLVILVPDLETTIGADNYNIIINVASSTVPEAVLLDLDARLETGGSYIDKVAELRSDLQIEG